MKKYIAYISLAAVVSLASCADFLDTYSPSEMTPETVFENADFTYRAAMGVYGCLPADRMYSQDLAIMWNAGSDMEIRTFTVDQAMSVDREPPHYLATATSGRIKDVWKALYECIERANNVVEGIEGSDIYANSGDKYNATFRSLRAEMIAIRAVCYMELTRHWGNVPFKDESSKSDLSNVFLPKTDKMEIYEKLIAQLNGCADDLPWKQGTPERVTRGFARGLAARFCLFRAGYDFTTDCRWIAPRADANAWYAEAARQCDIIMTQGGYSLEGTFESYFSKQCKRQYSPGESLYEVGFKLGGSSELAYSNGVRFLKSTSTYGFTTGGTIASTPAYYYSFHPEDTRRDLTVVYYCYDDPSIVGVAGNKTGVSRKIYTNIYDWLINKWNQKMGDDALHSTTYNAGKKIGTGINFPLMRYSDVLLMFAEATYHASGSATTAAKEALWEVRHRAIPTLTRGQFDAYVNGKDFQLAIEDERMWEFGGEGMRKFDLFRWGKLVQAIQEMRSVNGRIVDEWEYDFEFPTRADGRARAIPKTLYYKYDSNVEDFASINIDYDLPAPPDATYLTSEWIYKGLQTGSSMAANREKAHKYWSQANSGIVSTTGALVAGGRPYQPAPASVVNDYNDPSLFKQDYGF